MKKFFALAVVALVGFAACKKENNTSSNNNTNNNNNNNNNNNVIPTACFNISKTLVDTAERVQFTNCSQNADHYSWAIGGGAEVTGKDIDTFFLTRGQKTIILKALSKDNSNSNQASHIVDVGYRYITGFETKKFIFSGTPVTDLYLIFGPIATPDLYQTDTALNINWSNGASLKILDKFGAPVPSIKLDATNNGSWKFVVHRGSNGQSLKTFIDYPSRGAVPLQNLHLAVNSDTVNYNMDVIRVLNK
jgi:hypothetical protein